ncbi:MAG: hypothetical protein OSA21_05960 [Candidatus Poseidoniaceae archaeon]|nr:hypothetical protein [Candidatus Poseidoniaceae archaeon]
MDAYLSEYIDQVLDSQEYQNGIFSRSKLTNFLSTIFGRKA